jgi:uncharacterized membrane protein
MEFSLIIQQSINAIISALEIFGVIVIGFAFLHAIILGLLQSFQHKSDTFRRFKIYVGKALQLGLEFFVAADIIRTVSIRPTTIEGIVSLGLLVVVRTFLNWSITVEIEGCWPWQVAKAKKAA